MPDGVRLMLNMGFGVVGMALCMFKTPVPCSLELFQPLGTSTYLLSAACTSAGLIPGLFIIYIAAAPATCGAAIDVPFAGM